MMGGASVGILEDYVLKQRRLLKLTLTKRVLFKGKGSKFYFTGKSSEIDNIVKTIMLNEHGFSNCVVSKEP